MFSKPIVKRCFYYILPRGGRFLLQPLAECRFGEEFVGRLAKPGGDVFERFVAFDRWRKTRTR